jgi:hypothetical protein
MPPRIKGPLKYHLQPELCDVWGGAFNGQCFRQLIVTELLSRCEFSAIVETGTFRGTTTLFFVKNTFLPVFTVEFDATSFAFARHRLRKHSRVVIQRDDSRSFLKHLPIAADASVFFYLDAHWNADLPLEEEVNYIAAAYEKFVLMIDDFEVPGDPGYAFDDYGRGKQLSLRDFPFHKNARLECYFPRCPSQLESGAKRGCVVLASPGLAPSVRQAASLSVYPASSC